MARAPWGQWMLLTPGDEAGQQRARFLESAVLMPVISQHVGMTRIADVNVPIIGDASKGNAALRQLMQAEFVFADLTNHQPELLYHLGARDLMADKLTIVFHFGQAPLALEDMFGARLIKANENDPASASAMLRQVFTQGLQSDDDSYSSLLRKRLGSISIGLGSRRLPKSDQPRLWPVHALNDPSEVYSTRIGVWSGDLKEITKDDHIDALINSENTYLEMARMHDRGLSGSIRYLGANWMNNEQDSDDLIYRELIAKSGLHRPVAPGTTILTTSGKMRDRGVQVIAHVASVEPPRTPGGGVVAGAGYVPVNDLECCVRNVLRKLESHFGGLRALSGASDRTVLFPLFGTGNARGDARVISQRLINEAIKHVRERTRTRLGQILFLAYTDNDLALCIEAITNAEGVGPEITT